MDRNITLDEYKKIVENVKEAALQDMKAMKTCETDDQGRAVSSFFGMELRSRESDVDRCDGEYELYTDFEDLQEGMYSETEELEFGMHMVKAEAKSVGAWSDEDEEAEEPLTDRFYLRARKFIKRSGYLRSVYKVFFTIDTKEIFAVVPDHDLLECFEQHEDGFKQKMPVSPELEYILKNGRQLMQPWNVELPYRPGDILYVDIKPYAAPFYAVYCGENDKEYEHCLKCGCGKGSDFKGGADGIGYKMRMHPFIFTDQKSGAQSKERMWQCFGYRNYIFSGEDFFGSSGGGCNGMPKVIYPHTPYDRLTLVETCDDPDIMDASRKLKQG